MVARKNTEHFILSSRIIHGDVYDYSRVSYVNNITKVKIICHIHGEFKQIPNSHLSGAGCKQCAIHKRKELSTKTTEKFITQARNIHGNKYDYSLVKYINSYIKIKIICPVHGTIIQIPNDHLNGRGCHKCAIIERQFKLMKTTKQFINDSIRVHGNIYDYSLVEYKGSHNKIKISCTDHGIFEQTPASHLNGSGCPICKTSKGENIIRKWLNDNNIRFIEQKRFNSCRNKKPLPFDFFIPSKKLLIEFDGIQHFKEIESWGGIQSFEEIKKRDSIKNKWVVNSQYDLIRIKYDEDVIKILNNINMNIRRF